MQPHISRVQCARYIKTIIANPHSNIWSFGGIRTSRRFGWVKYQLKESTTIPLIGYDRSTSSTTFEHSSVALENIWRGREERNPRHKHEELGELTGAGGRPASRSCGFQECAQTLGLAVTLSVSSAPPFPPPVCLTCNLHSFQSWYLGVEKRWMQIFCANIRSVWQFFLPKSLKGVVWHLGTIRFLAKSKMRRSHICVVNIKLEPAAG